MKDFEAFLAQVEHPIHRALTAEVLAWVAQTFPLLSPKIAWNQPMFTDHGTFIIGFSVARAHLAVAPERATILRFSDAIRAAGFDHSKELLRLPWDRPAPYALLEAIIRFNLADKAACKTFWRKPGAAEEA